MKVNRMRFLDDKFGPLICFVFFWYNAAKGLIFRRPYNIEPDKIKNIMVIKFFGMGSIILATPMMRALKQRFPNAKLVFLTFSGNEELCKRIDLIDEVVTVDPGNLLKFAGDLYSKLLYLRRKRCEISIDLEFFSKSSTIVQYICGAKVRVGYYLVQYGLVLKMMWRGDLLTHNVYYNPNRHTIEVFLALARKIGVDTKDWSLARVRIGDDDRARLNNLLSEMGVGGQEGRVVVNINAHELCFERRWPLEKFAELTNKMLGRGDFKLFLIGDKNDDQYVKSFIAMLPDTARVVNLTGRMSIGMLGALLENTRLLISNDSGPLHLAASLDVPTVALFGPETPERYGCFGDKHSSFYEGIYCSPCLNVYNQKVAPCNGDNECMRRISVEDVYKVVAEKYLR